MNNTRGRVLDRGLDAFVAEAERGYPEAAHVMAFPRAQGFMVERDEQVGDIFQRACMVETLVAIRDRTGRDLRDLIVHETDYLLSMRRGYAPGGWSYFPTLHELPPDADDLAVVIRALIAANRRDAVTAHCVEPLLVLIEECRTGPGMFETWIVPRRGAAVHDRQRWWIANAWGQGPDCEVIANLVHALTRFDSVRYAGTIAECAARLGEIQAADGSWPSSWYHGSFYAGWLCSLALGAQGKPTARWRAYLRDSQRQDGGWGWSGTSDVLSTAFAVLALPADDAASARGRRFLEKTQDEDGLWPAIPWIKMELGRSQGCIRQVLSYGSRTISGSFALQALLHSQEENRPWPP
jgi:squalene-hopene/tetraprenyl-beta-curcumene cyclase